MIDIARLRKEPEHILKLLQDRVEEKNLEILRSADENWRETKQRLDKALSQRNELSKQAKENPQARKRVKELKKKLEVIKRAEREAKKRMETLLLSIHNIPLPDVPPGKTAKDNVVVRKEGKIPKFNFTPKDYLSLRAIENYIGLEEAREASGARFAYIKGKAAQLEYALLRFAIDFLSKEKFELIFPPTIIKKETMKKMGYLDQVGEQEVFHLQNPIETSSEFVLVGTAEQSLGAMVMGKTFSYKELPKRYMAFTPCYRREAGSYGKDTRGILRVHQFEKLEMFSVTEPKDSEKEHAFLLSLQESMMKQLNIPYRVVGLCAGDLGLPSARTLDIESFLPGQNQGKGEYRETHSTSNCTDFQARRLQVKVQTADGKKLLAHTINATAFAMQRTLIAIMENYQNEDGTFAVPNALKPFFP